MTDAGQPCEGPLVHVGYHKTGTSWLQGVLADPRAGFASFPRRDLLDRLVLAPPFRFDREEVRAFFARAVAEARSKSLVTAFSHERLSGNPHSGGYDAPLLADRLADVFPGARILIVIREQKSMIASVYKQYVLEGGVQSLGSYLHPPRSGRARIPLFRFSFFEYDALVDHYQRRFGRERVLVLCFEELRRDARAFAARIASFAGLPPPGELSTAPVNVAPSALATALQRPANLLLVRDTLNPLGWSEDPRLHEGVRRAVASLERLVPRSLRRMLDRRLSERVTVEVGDRYRESNRATRTLTGLDLARHGYDL
jgi:hypothetical protein